METEKLQNVFIVSSANGCLTNLMETTTLRKALQTDHYQSCETAEDSDVIIVNTCGYNVEAENTSMDVIQNYQAKYPGKKVVVTGCLPRINGARLKKEFAGPIVSTGELEKLNTHFEKPLAKTDQLQQDSSALNPADLATRLPSNQMAEKLSPFAHKLRVRFGLPGLKVLNILDSMVFDQQTFAVTVATGCLGKCTYCAIKKAKGGLVSRNLPDIVENVKRALAQGYTRIHLLGDDVGCWGQDQGLTSAHLLSAIFRLPQDFQLIINYFDPTWLVRFYSDLQGPLSDPRLVCLNVPMQSGDDRVLKAMDRHYETAAALECVRDIRFRNPGLALKTHIMVGYPGETHEQFQASLKILSHFDLVYPNKYGPRPGTPAEKLPQLPELTKSFRFALLKVGIQFVHLSVLVRSLFSGGSLERNVKA